MSQTTKNISLEGRARFVHLAAGIAAPGGLLFGYDLAVIAGAILYIKAQFGLTPGLEEIIVSAALLGALIGAAGGGILADRYGRRLVLILTAAVGALGALGTALAPTIAGLIVGRVIIGIAFGICAFTVPLYIAEISPVHARGRLVSIYSLAIMIGILTSYLVDYVFSTFQAWRWMFGLGAIPAVMLGIGVLFLPESPRWLLIQARAQEAEAELKRIRGTTDVDDEFQGIQNSLGQQHGHWSELANPLLKTALVFGFGLAMFRHVTGLNTATLYAPTIFAFAGFESASVDILATVGIGFIFVLITIVAMYLVDRVGRRPLVMIGLAGMVLSMTALGLVFKTAKLSGVTGSIAVGSLWLFVASWTIGLGTVFYVLISEIYPLKIRGLAMSLVTAVLWGAYLLATLTFLTLIRILGRPATFWLYALLGIFAFIFAYFLTPETRGYSLEEIEAHWRAGKRPRDLGR